MPFLHCEGKWDITDQMELFTIDRDSRMILNYHRHIGHGSGRSHSTFCASQYIWETHFLPDLFSWICCQRSWAENLEPSEVFFSNDSNTVVCLRPNMYLCLHCNTAIYYKKTTVCGVYLFCCFCCLLFF